MNTFLQAYEIPFAKFQDIMMHPSYLMAGSAGLALYLEQNGIDAGYEPNDMDIWVKEGSETVMEHSRYVTRLNGSTLITLLEQNGYITNRVYSAQPDEEASYMAMSKQIKKIMYFKNASGKEVQLIYIQDMDLIDYIRTYFDLSICVTWWNAAANIFDTLYPPMTLKHKMFTINIEGIDQIHYEQRLGKYLLRGFSLCSGPPLYHHNIDERMKLDTSSFQGKTAFDVWAYDEVDCVEYLRESDWHILLKIGDQIQAYHRNDLVQYMKEHTTSVLYLGDICDTPNNQSIMYDACQHFMYSDYSIFELVPSYSLSLIQSFRMTMPLKTIYELRCYSVKNFDLECTSFTIHPPRIEQFQEAVFSYEVPDIDGINYEDDELLSLLEM